MRPAATQNPKDYLLALVLAASPIVGSVWVEPASTRWVVLGVGIFMVLSVLVAAAWPIES